MMKLPSSVKQTIEKIACRRCGAKYAACISPQEHEVFASVAFHDQDHRSEFCYERVFDYFESFRSLAPPREEYVTLTKLPSSVRHTIEKIACRRCGAKYAACISPQEHEVFASIAFLDQDHRSEFCYERVFDYFESSRPPEALPREQATAKLFESRYDGLILCEEHFIAAFEEMSPPDRERVHSSKGDGHELVMDTATREVLRPRCAMCGQIPSPGRTCQGCETPLHPLWPACYCSDECAYKDA